MYKIMYHEIGRCGVAHRLRCYEDYCTCTLASSALLSAVSLARAQFSGKRAQALFAGMATHSVLSSEAPASAAVSLTLMAAGHASGWPILRRLADHACRRSAGNGLPQSGIAWRLTDQYPSLRRGRGRGVQRGSRCWGEGTEARGGPVLRRSDRRGDRSIWTRLVYSNTQGGRFARGNEEA